AGVDRDRVLAADVRQGTGREGRDGHGGPGRRVCLCLSRVGEIDGAWRSAGRWPARAVDGGRGAGGGAGEPDGPALVGALLEVEEVRLPVVDLSLGEVIRPAGGFVVEP